MTVFGIDLGGTSIRIGYRDAAGGVVVVPGPDGEPTVPAALWYVGPDDVRIGREALAAAAAHPDDTITSARADLLDPAAAGGRRDRYLQGSYDSPEAVVRRLYADAVRRAAAYAGEPVGDVVIGFPLSAGRAAALRTAASLAGLNVIASVAEPVAAALHYGAVREGVDHLTVVCDLGGSTLDVTVLRVVDRNVQIMHSVTEPVASTPADRAVALVGSAVAAAAVTAGERPETVLLAGGASQIPAIGLALGERLGLEVREQDPELAVLSGLVIAADFGPLWVTRAGVGAPRPTTRQAEPSRRPAPAGHASPGPAPGPELAPSPRHPADPEPAPSAVRQDLDPAHARPNGRTADPEPAGPSAAGAAVPARPERAYCAPGPDAITGGDETSALPRAGPAADVGAAIPRWLAPDQDAAHGELTGQPVEQLSFMRRDRHVLLTWIWPDGSLAAQVRWRDDADPAGRYSTARCARRVYEHDGGFTLPIGRGGATITVEAMVPGAELDDRPPSVLRVVPGAPVVTYEPDLGRDLRRSLRRWAVTVTFVGDCDCELPAVLVVLGTGSYRPTSVRDGEVLHEVQAQRLAAGQPLIVPFMMSPRRRPFWLVCLPADPDAAAVDLRPTALHRLRVG